MSGDIREGETSLTLATERMGFGIGKYNHEVCELHKNTDKSSSATIGKPHSQ